LLHLLTTGFGTKCESRRVGLMTAVGVESGLRSGAAFG
jgi:hypothetical protein